MTDILLIITILCFVKNLFTASLLPSFWQKLLIGLICFAVVWFLEPYAIQINKFYAENVLLKYDNILNINLFTTVDLLLTFTFCHLIVKKQQYKKLQLYEKILLFLPFLSFLPIVFYWQIQTFFLFWGQSFLKLTFLFSVFIFLLITGISSGISKIITTRTIFLEIIGILSLFLFVFSVCCMVLHPTSVIIYNTTNYINFREFIFSFLTLLLGFVVGFLSQKIKKYIKKYQ
ncbi:MAG: hypothetical protein LBR36_09050 [Bacteroidales bacterium]|jgi:hypothetical protein|nr:hypothetical protein [Bacteroidales bacterium]